MKHSRDYSSLSQRIVKLSTKLGWTLKQRLNFYTSIKGVHPLIVEKKLNKLERKANGRSR